MPPLALAGDGDHMVASPRLGDSCSSEVDPAETGTTVEPSLQSTHFL